jgi:parvulin-like peptidyl-prolyl isomerase
MTQTFRRAVLALVISITPMVSPFLHQTMAQSLEGNEGPWLVEVNGKKLTRSQAEHTMGSRNSRITDEAWRKYRESSYERSIEAFIERTLLLDEAARRVLTASREETIESFTTRYTMAGSAEKARAKFASLPSAVRSGNMQLATIEKLKIDLAKDMTFSPEEITAYRETVKETIHPRHILISVPRKANPEQKAAAVQKGNRIRRKILEGADFAEMAKHHSDCYSKAKGGDLGLITRGKMVKSFDDVVFSQEIGKIGSLVETPFGYHIVEVLSHTSGGSMPRADVAAALRSKAAKVMVPKLVAQLTKTAVIRYP